jgi:stage V sporulation protein G
MEMDIKINRIHKFDETDPSKSLRAFADIEVNDSFLIKGLQVMNGKKGLFVSMPRQKGKDNKWYETVRALKPEIKAHIDSIVLASYATTD